MADLAKIQAIHVTAQGVFPFLSDAVTNF